MIINKLNQNGYSMSSRSLKKGWRKYKYLNFFDRVFMFKLQIPKYDEWNIINWFRNIYIYIYIYIINIICSKTLCKLFRSSVSAYCFLKQICWIILDVIPNLLFITLNLNRLPILSYEWENRLQKIKIRQIHFFLYLHWKISRKKIMAQMISTVKQNLQPKYK